MSFLAAVGRRFPGREWRDVKPLLGEVEFPKDENRPAMGGTELHTLKNRTSNNAVLTVFTFRLLSRLEPSTTHPASAARVDLTLVARKFCRWEQTFFQLSRVLLLHIIHEGPMLRIE